MIDKIYLTEQIKSNFPGVILTQEDVTALSQDFVNILNDTNAVDPIVEDAKDIIFLTEQIQSNFPEVILTKEEVTAFSQDLVNILNDIKEKATIINDHLGEESKLLMYSGISFFITGCLILPTYSSIYDTFTDALYSLTGNLGNPFYNGENIVFY